MDITVSAKATQVPQVTFVTKMVPHATLELTAEEVELLQELVLAVDMRWHPDCNRDFVEKLAGAIVSAKHQIALAAESSVA
jgi:hypothetical protein